MLTVIIIVGNNIFSPYCDCVGVFQVKENTEEISTGV